MIATLIKVVAPGSSAAEDNPLWLIVLCDLMTNLMLFFLILYSFSLKTEEEKDAAMRELQGSIRREVVHRYKKEELIERVEEQEAAAAILKEFEQAGLRELTQVDVTESRIRIRMAAPVLFPSGAAELTETARRRLRPLGRMLKGLPNTLVVEGHTDSVPLKPGPYRNNRELSAARAAAVIRHLAQAFGIPQARFVAAGYGEFRPASDNATARGRGRNRRIEVLVMRKSSVAVMGKVKGGPDDSRRLEFEKGVVPE